MWWVHFAKRNVQVASGQPVSLQSPKDKVYRLNVNTLGRLTNVEQFEDVILKTGGSTKPFASRTWGKLN